jgi:hypothetical protein
MNDRTLTPNPQLDQLISVLTPDRPVNPLLSTWHQLDANAREVAQVANVKCFPNEPTEDFGFFAVVLAGFIICLIALQASGRRLTV